LAVFTSDIEADVSVSTRISKGQGAVLAKKGNLRHSTENPCYSSLAETLDILNELDGPLELIC
jgi:hypothetical protein